MHRDQHEAAVDQIIAMAGKLDYLSECWRGLWLPLSSFFSVHDQASVDITEEKEMLTLYKYI